MNRLIFLKAHGPVGEPMVRADVSATVRCMILGYRAFTSYIDRSMKVRLKQWDELTWH